MENSILGSSTFNIYDNLYDFMKGHCLDSTHSGDAIFFCLQDECDSRYLCSECLIENPVHFTEHMKCFLPIDNKIKFMKFTNLHQLEAKNLNNLISLNDKFDIEKIKPIVENNFQAFYEKLKHQIILIINEHMDTKLQNYITSAVDSIKDSSLDKIDKLKYSNFINEINFDIDNFIKSNDRIKFAKFYNLMKNKMNCELKNILKDSYEENKFIKDKPFIYDFKINIEILKNEIFEIIHNIIQLNLEDQIFNKNLETIKFKHDTNNDYNNIFIKKKSTTDIYSKLNSNKILTFASDNESDSEETNKANILLTSPAELQSKNQVGILETLGYDAYTIQTENPSKSDSIKNRLDELKIKLSNLKKQI